MEEKKKEKLIKDFFKEKLTKDEKKEFLKKASSDRDFVKDFVNELEKKAEGQDSSTEEDEEIADDSNITTLNFYRAIRISTLATGFVLGLLLIQSIFLPTNRQLYKQNFEPISAANYITRGQTSTETDFQKGIGLYYQGNYKTSWKHLSISLDGQEPSREIILFAGLSLMGLNEFQNAIDVFEMANDQELSNMPEISWYLALSYVKNGDRDKAAISLAKLSNTEGMMGNKASHLLKKLR